MLLLSHGLAAVQNEDSDKEYFIMKKNSFLVAAVLSIAFSSSAIADLVGVDWIYGPNQHPDGQHTTFQIFASFSVFEDQISAVACNPDGNALDFWTSDGSDIYNQAVFDGLPLND